jgi:6-phosphofructokinase 1
MSKNIAVLTAGGDSPGLNAAIRGLGKAGHRSYDMRVIGFLDGFRGLMQNRMVRLEGDSLSGILTVGGTILGTSRDKPHKMEVGGKVMDMTDLMVENYRRHDLDALVCLGGGGTQRSALRLARKGINVVTLPKTIDNDVAHTDQTFGFDTALGIATEAVDRLHSTAHSHHRIMVVEIMGHNAGWLALGAGLAGGADVILIPEIPYRVGEVANSILERKTAGSRFSLVAVSEGAISKEDADLKEELLQIKKRSADGEEQERAAKALRELNAARAEGTPRLARRLEELTRLEARVTILGHIQRGGTPSPVDRLLATRLGTEAARAIDDGIYGVMIGSRSGEAVPVPLEDVAGRRRVVPPDHPWIRTARSLGVSLGD